MKTISYLKKCSNKKKKLKIVDFTITLLNLEISKLQTC